MQRLKWEEYIYANEAALIDRLAKAVSIPSVSSSPAHRPDVIRMGMWLKDELTKLGVSVDVKDLGLQQGTEHQLPPVLIGRLGTDSKKRTILVYGHYDVQPASKSDGWTTEDPFKLDVDPVTERLIGRGSSDDKGPLLGWLNVVEAHQKTNTPLPVNLVFLFEGMEESGSEGLAELVRAEAHKALGGVDAICISDNYWLGTNKPCVTYGLRGLTYFNVTVSGSGVDLHSGMFGGVVHEPMVDLCNLLSGLVSSNGEILIDGLNEMVQPLTTVEKNRYSTIDITHDALVHAAGGTDNLVKTDDGVVGLLLRRMRLPSLSVHGIEGAFSGQGAKTVIPTNVTGKFSIRLVPDMDPKAVDKCVRFHLENHFASLKSPNSMTVSLLSGDKAWLGNVDDWNYRAAISATREVYGVEPDLTREGGSIPITLTLSDALGVSALLLPMGRGDDGAHSTNEKLDKSNYLNGCRLLGRYLHRAATG